MPSYSEVATAKANGWTDNGNGTYTNQQGQIVNAGGQPLGSNGQPVAGGQGGQQIPGGATTQVDPTAASLFAPNSLGSQLTNQLTGPDGVQKIGLGNNNQVQGGAQAGSFESAGSQSQQQAQTQTQIGNTAQQQVVNGSQQGQETSSGQTTQFGNQTGQTSNEGQTTGTSQNDSRTVGTTQNLGQSTTGVTDTLGFGELLKNQAGQAQATDADRSAYLSDLMKTGGTAFQDQVQAATNQAVSGPGMQGVGDSALSRAAGYAVANVARNNQDQRLQAAQQLAGGTATTNLSNAGNAYLGSTQQQANTGVSDQSTAANTASQQQQASTGTSSQQNIQQGNNSNTSNTNSNTQQGTTATGQSSNISSSLSDLLSKSASSGISNAQNAQAAYGTTPSQTSSSGGGSVICTVLGERGMLPRWMLEAELIYVERNLTRFRKAAKGYLFWGEAVAKLARKNKLVANMCLPFAKACAYEASRRANIMDLPRFLWPTIAFYSFLIVNTALGQFIPGEPKLRDPALRKLMSDSGLELNLGE